MEGKFFLGSDAFFALYRMLNRPRVHGDFMFPARQRDVESGSQATVTFDRNDFKNDQGRFVPKCHHEMAAKPPNFSCGSRRPRRCKTTANNLNWKKNQIFLTHFAVLDRFSIAIMKYKWYKIEKSAVVLRWPRPWNDRCDVFTKSCFAVILSWYFCTKRPWSFCGRPTCYCPTDILSKWLTKWPGLYSFGFLNPLVLQRV